MKARFQHRTFCGGLLVTASFNRESAERADLIISRLQKPEFVLTDLTYCKKGEGQRQEKGAAEVYSEEKQLQPGVQDQLKDESFEIRPKERGRNIW